MHMASWLNDIDRLKSNTGRKFYQSATFSTTDLTGTGIGSNHYYNKYKILFMKILRDKQFIYFSLLFV